MWHVQAVANICKQTQKLPETDQTMLLEQLFITALFLAQSTDTKQYEC